MKNLLPLFLLIFSLSVVSCGGGGESSEEENTETTEASALPQVLQNGTTTLDLSDYFMPFSLYIPDSNRGYPNVEETGYGTTIVDVGSTYHLVIAEGGDLAGFKTQMQDDLMYKNTIVEEGADYILYKSEIADSHLDPEFHFYAIKTVNGVSFEFHDFNEEGGYAESVARFMLESVNHIIANEGA